MPSRTTFKCCGKHTHLRLLAKQVGRKKARKYLAEIYEILPEGETAHTAITANNGRDQLIIKSRRDQQKLVITAVYWQRWFHMSPKTSWWLKNSRYVFALILHEATRSLIRRIFE